ncbi:MAG TPA: LON peptidase substrate-binding domain-containing protein, partial [Polyangiaceae bacterium]|nr:LON peptidase substrate-binding domain-containing protein [Polyangiaceae bacterium]
MNENGPPSLSLPDVLPVLPMRDTVVYPDTAAPVLVGQPRSLELVYDLKGDAKRVALVAQKNAERVPARPEDLYAVGTMASVHELARVEGAVRLVAQGVARIRIVDFVRSHPYLVARIEAAPEAHEQGPEIEGLMRTAKDLFGRFVAMADELPNELAAAAAGASDPRQVAYLIASMVPLTTAVRQEILELDPVSAKLRRIVALLQHELAVRDVIQRVTRETTEEVTRAQREQILRKHLEALQRELGDGDASRETHDLREKLDRLAMPEEAKAEASRELDRLERTPEASPEYGMIRTYLDWLLKMPWGKLTGGRIDVQRARAVLDEDHFDLEKIKDRIVDYLAVKHLRDERMQELQGKDVRTEPILCFLGPPGVGKTSLGQSIARAMGRAFVRQS